MSMKKSVDINFVYKNLAQLSRIYIFIEIVKKFLQFNVVVLYKIITKKLKN